MSAMTNILVKDDATTAKEWTFEPITDTPNPFWRANDASLSVDGQPRLNVSIQKLKNGGYKATVKLEVPTMETLGSAGTSLGYVAPQKVAYVTTGILTLFADKRSTISDRVNCFKMLVGVCQGASNATATGTLSQCSAGDSWKNSGYPLPPVFSRLVVPN